MNIFLITFLITYWSRIERQKKSRKKKKSEIKKNSKRIIFNISPQREIWRLIEKIINLSTERINRLRLISSESESKRRGEGKNKKWSGIYWVGKVEMWKVRFSLCRRRKSMQRDAYGWWVCLLFSLFFLSSSSKIFSWLTIFGMSFNSLAHLAWFKSLFPFSIIFCTFLIIPTSNADFTRRDSRFAHR